MRQRKIKLISFFVPLGKLTLRGIIGSYHAMPTGKVLIVLSDELNVPNGFNRGVRALGSSAKYIYIMYQCLQV